MAVPRAIVIVPNLSISTFIPNILNYSQHPSSHPRPHSRAWSNITYGEDMSAAPKLRGDLVATAQAWSSGFPGSSILPLRRGEHRRATA